MDAMLPYLLAAAMAATVLVLFAGIVSFAFGGKLSTRHATTLMSLRVGLQGLAILLFALIVLLKIVPV